MKIAIAQITTYPGRIGENTTKIIKSIKKAKKSGADLVVFPELAIPGYCSLDLFQYPDFIAANQQAVDQIIPHTRGIAVIVGFVDSDNCRLGPDGTHRRYNSAAVIQNGRLLGVEDKTLLPDYDVFDENRYFQPARRRSIYKINGKKIGLEICEDLWDEYYSLKVSRELVKKGAEILINISASPYSDGKSALRLHHIKKIVNRYHLPFVYANLVGSFDGYEGQLVFDGQSLVITSSGKLIKIGRSFCEDLIIVDLNKSFSPLSFSSSSVADLYQALVLGIREYFYQSGFQKTYIGLSGGIDSALVAALAVAALGADNVTGVSLPSVLTSSASIQDARELAANLKIKFEIIPISPAHSVLSRQLNPSDLTNQNIQARLRGLILMALANENRALLLTTGNKTETALGYCTLYGDMAGALAPISDVDKLKVYELCDYINSLHQSPLIPLNTITKAPTAELSPGQTDENGLGAPYSTIVPITNALVEHRSTVAELSKKYPKKLVGRYWKLINGNEYKRRQAAPGIRVTAKSFGVGRRLPLSYQFIRQ